MEPQKQRIKKQSQGFDICP